jgi:hypothetical protein
MTGWPDGNFSELFSIKKNILGYILVWWLFCGYFWFLNQFLHFINTETLLTLLCISNLQLVHWGIVMGPPPDN